MIPVKQHVRLIHIIFGYVISKGVPEIAVRQKSAVFYVLITIYIYGILFIEPAKCAWINILR